MQPNDSPIQNFDRQRSSEQTPSETSAASEITPVEALQKRYADQLSQDIEQLEAQKAQLREDIQTLTQAYQRLLASITSLRNAERSASRAADAARQSAAETERSPRLPGEPDAIHNDAAFTGQDRASDSRSIDLPIPATSAQRRQLSIQSRHVDKVNSAAIARKGFVLSAIATLLMAWHFGAIATIAQGGRWLGISIGALGTGFMPAVALLWLRMLVMVPALVLLAPQLHEDVWEDLRDWTYRRDELLMLLIGSGVALFISQALLYQCLGTLGAAIGAALLFLYPVSAAPLSAIFERDRPLSALSGLALVAIAMGGVLALKPTFLSDPSSVWLGLVASVAFSLYILLTNLSYRQPKCHPIPASLVQFIVVATISSIVLLVKPLEPVDIGWLSLAFWGLWLGFVMLLVYLLSYSSLRLIGPQAAAVTAAVPLLTLAIAWSFSPTPSLAIIQWTGIALVSVGGIALGKERR